MTQKQQLKEIVSTYFYKGGESYGAWTKAIRPFISASTFQSCLKIIDAINVDFEYCIFSYENGVHFEIDKSPEHFVNFSITDQVCTRYCSEHNDEWFESENITDLDWVIDSANKVFA